MSRTHDTVINLDRDYYGQYNHKFRDEDRNFPFDNAYTVYNAVAVITLAPEHPEDGTAPIKADVNSASAAGAKINKRRLKDILGEASSYPAAPTPSTYHHPLRRSRRPPSIEEGLRNQNDRDLDDFWQDRTFKQTKEPEYPAPKQASLILGLTPSSGARVSKYKSVEGIKHTYHNKKRQDAEALDKSDKVHYYGARHAVDTHRFKQLKAKLVFQESSNPMVTLDLCLTWTNIASQEVSINVRIHMSCETMRRPPTFKDLKDAQVLATQTGLTLDAARALLESGTDSHFNFHLRGDPVHASNLFNLPEMYGPHASIIDDLRCFVTRDWDLSVFGARIDSSKKFIQTFNAISAACDPFACLVSDDIEPDDLPHVAHPSVVVYGNDSQMLATELQGALLEGSITSQGGMITISNVPASMVFLTASQHQAAHLFLHCTSDSILGRLTMGTSIYVDIPHLNHTARPQSWTGTVTELQPGLEPGTIHCVIYAPQIWRFNKTYYQRIDVSKLPAADKQFEHDLKQTQSEVQVSVSGLPRHCVDIMVKTDNSTRKCILRVMEKHHQLITMERKEDVYQCSSTSTLLNAIRLDRLPFENWLEGIDAPILEQLKLNLNQQGIIEYLSKVPRGVAIIDGVAGSGKTHMILQIVKALVTQRRTNDNGTIGQVLVICPLNLIVDKLALSIKQTLQDLDNPPQVVRAYSGDLDNTILLHQGHQQRKQYEATTKYDVYPHDSYYSDSDEPDDTRDDWDDFVTLDDEMRDSIFADIEQWTNTLGLALFKQQKKNPFETYVHDKRVRPEPMMISPGHIIFVRAGLTGRGRGRAPYFRFADMYRTWLDDLSLNDKWLENFAVAYYKCLIDVYRTADVLVCTPRVALDERVMTNISPTHLIVDEAGKANNFEMTSVFGCFPTVHKHLFLLDHLQLGAVVGSNPGNNIFAAQLKCSLPLRLAAAGFPTMTLSYQQRYGASLCRILSNLFCAGQLHIHPDWKDPFPAAYKAIKKDLGVRTRVIIVDTKTEGQKTAFPTMSRYNKETAKTAMGLVRKLSALTDDLLLKDMMIITPYTAQETVLKNARKELIDHPELAYPSTLTSEDWASLTIDTIDRAQGTQKYLVILDIPATDTIGHINEPLRLFTALTRAQGIVIVVADFEKLRPSNNKSKGILARFEAAVRVEGNYKKATEDLNIPVLDNHVPFEPVDIQRAHGVNW